MKKVNTGFQVLYFYVAIVVVCVFAFCVTPANADLIAAYNENANHASGYFWPYSIGYLWEAPIDFSLTGIETKFTSGSKTVTIAIYDEFPHVGGTMLASKEYDATGGLWGGATFSPLALKAGEQYFIGFLNVVGLGVCFTQDNGSTLFSADGYVHYDSNGSPPAAFTESYFGQANAIIRIYGDPVPEPATLSLLALGAILTGRRQRRN